MEYILTIYLRPNSYGDQLSIDCMEHLKTRKFSQVTTEKLHNAENEEEEYLKEDNIKIKKKVARERFEGKNKRRREHEENNAAYSEQCGERHQRNIFHHNQDFGPNSFAIQ